MRILIVEEPQWIEGNLLAQLAGHGFNAETAHGSLATARMVRESYDAVVVNPDVAGCEFTQLAAELEHRGVLLVHIREEAAGHSGQFGQFGLWADLPRPVSAQALIAKLQEHRRRRSTAVQLRLGSLEVDLEQHRAFRDEREIPLTILEFKLLVLLLTHAGQALSRTLIAERIWGKSEAMPSNAVDVAVMRLRRKVDAPGDAPLIQTIRGVGYSADLT